ncbi:MAG: phenylalanine--tRNA ligase subunit alpha [Patescibacteria group bacterium]
MQEKLTQLKKTTLSTIAGAAGLADLEEIENKILGRKAGELTELMKGLKDLPLEEKKTIGALANEVKIALEQAVAEKRSVLGAKDAEKMFAAEAIDLSAPALPKNERGHFHPNTIVQRSIEELFSKMGFIIADGPELESDYFNFTSINIPADHPARDTQDTFYVKDHPAWVMRTQTSAVQVRAMREHGAPLRVIVPGKCFRNESTDARHEHTFYQLEGFAVDKNLTLAHMKGVLETVARHLFGPNTEVRLRPKFYPFVEPGVNGEVTCSLCAGSGCRVCKHTGWMEIFGAGMIHPNVLKEGGIDPKVYQGFAFGFGLSRLAMMKYSIDDVRLMESGDLRFIKQF